MSDIAIHVNGISKRYQIGVARERYVALRDVIARRVKRMSRWMLRRQASSTPTTKDFWALRDISFEVKRGECVGIIGRNGAGKSTLLKILSRITEPTEGEIRLRGRVGCLLEVGTGFHPELTGRENIFLNGAILGMTRREIARKFDEIVAFSEVEKFLDTSVKYYSSGMYTRLAFAVAAHLEPEILVVDEVLAVGDAEFQKKCLGKMGEVARGGRTVLFVSHNMTAISQLCNRACWLEQGILKTTGSAVDLVRQYSASFARVAHGEIANAVGQGDGTVLPIEYTVTNHLGTTSPLPVTNEDLRIHVQLKVANPIQRPAYGIEIQNVEGVRMLCLNTVEMGIDPPPLPDGVATVEFRVKKAPYVPGPYRAKFWVMNAQGHIYMMTHSDAISFEIGQSRLYGARDIDHRYGCVYAEVEVSTTHGER